MTLEEMIFVLEDGNGFAEGEIESIIRALRAGHGMYQDLKDMGEETDSVRAWDAATKGDGG